MLELVLVLLFGLLAFALMLRWREPSMIYYPMREMEGTPAQAGLKFEDVWLTTSDGVKIHGWYVPAAGTAATTILFLHGNAGNISHRLEKLAILHNLGAATLIIDYRGYGLSDNRQPDEQGTYHDAQAAYDWLAKRHSQIILYGESLGTAVAVELATRVSCNGLIIEEPFTSIADVGQKMFPFLPVRLIAKTKYDSLSKMPKLRAPLLILHSREDEMFPMSYAERLLAAAPEPKRLVELRGSHNDAFLVSAPVYRQALADFLAARR
ncbi:MAG: alpha/beta hydrolase [Verrucomicrobia bacterium]|nr:alpha/beta hydrolase [Verrucomicrobiota bacterium]